jgi:hypothetical protein
LDIYITLPISWSSIRAIHKALSEKAIEAFSNFYNSGAEMVEGAALLSFAPPNPLGREHQPVGLRAGTGTLRERTPAGIDSPERGNFNQHRTKISNDERVLGADVEIVVAPGQLVPSRILIWQ